VLVVMPSKPEDLKGAVPLSTAEDASTMDAHALEGDKTLGEDLKMTSLLAGALPAQVLPAQVVKDDLIEVIPLLLCDGAANID